MKSQAAGSPYAGFAFFTALLTALPVTPKPAPTEIKGRLLFSCGHDEDRISVSCGMDRINGSCISVMGDGCQFYRPGPCQVSHWSQRTLWRCSLQIHFWIFRFPDTLFFLCRKDFFCLRIKCRLLFFLYHNQLYLQEN